MNTNHHKIDQSHQVGMVNTPRGYLNRRGVLLPGLWAARVSAALSQRDLAAMIGTTQKTICKLEGQKRGAYPKTVRRLCKALEVEPSALMYIGVTTIIERKGNE